MTYLQMVELLIPRVIRELFVSRDDPSISLALLLANKKQREILLAWYVGIQIRNHSSGLPFLEPCNVIYGPEAMSYMDKAVNILKTTTQRLEDELL